MSNPWEIPQESEEEKREKALAILGDPEKRQQFELIIEQLKQANPEQLAKIQETGTLSVLNENDPTEKLSENAKEKGIEFNMHIGISPEVIKTITEAIQAGQKDAMEIAKKIPPEMLLMLLA
ncbi:MAG: hypothetical protein WC757_03565 [Candidatus Paceibacterota bacterium]|jgi:hypothetical protein